MTDTKIIGSSTTVRLELPGYEVLNAVITRNEEFDAGACLGGVFLLFPFLWIQGYRPFHSYEMRPLGLQPPGAWGPPPPGYPAYPQSGTPPPGYPPNYPPNLQAPPTPGSPPAAGPAAPVYPPAPVQRR